ncbi:aminopeptidase P family protein, partial [Candidatus Woesearchaeota archaeon]|nr:aminopeptidase P family protein [Candidatus Woesearchaeota archaeon]
MRLKQLSQELRKRKIDAAFFLSTDTNIDKSVLYFSGAETESSMFVKNGKATLFVKSLELENARKRSTIKAMTWKGDFFKFLRKRMGNVRVMGINKESLSLNAYRKLRKAFPKTKFRDVSKLVKNLREIKTKEEIIIMKKAARIGDKIFSKLIKKIKNFKTEKQVMKFIIEETRKSGCEPSFPPIVASGNSAVPHNEATGKLKKGFCFIDFGVKFRGYCSDMTRTIFIGKLKENDTEIYNLVLKAQEE